MASAETTEIFNCSMDQFYKIISDYEKYPEFLSEVSKTKVIETSGARKLVEYQVTVIKSFKYRLWMTEDGPRGIKWSLDSGDLFKKSEGSWDLQEMGSDKVKATYRINADFKVFVPGPVAKALVNVNLPNMIEAYQKRVRELYG